MTIWFLSVVLLVLTGGLMWMARPPFFPTGERISIAAASLFFGLGTFLMLTKLAKAGASLVGSMVILAMLAGWFWPELEKKILRFKDPGLGRKAP